MKYLNLSVCFLVSLSGYSQAKKVSPEKKAELVTKLYHLNPNQSSLCLDLLKDKLASLEELDKGVYSLKDYQAAKLAIDKTYNDNFESILDPEQKVIFQRHRLISEKPKKTVENARISTAGSLSGKGTKK